MRTSRPLQLDRFQARHPYRSHPPQIAVPSAGRLVYAVDRVVGLSPTEERAAYVTDSGRSLPHRIRVLIVDDHAAVRQAVATVVAAFPDLELAGQAPSAEEAVRLCESTRPDVILLDVTLPDVDGAAAMRAILERYPASRVIATCTFQEEELIPEALNAGAAGSLLKNVSADELASAIRATYATPLVQTQRA